MVVIRLPGTEVWRSLPFKLCIIDVADRPNYRPYTRKMEPTFTLYTRRQPEDGGGKDIRSPHASAIASNALPESICCYSPSMRIMHVEQFHSY